MIPIAPSPGWVAEGQIPAREPGPIHVVKDFFQYEYAGTNFHVRPLCGAANIKLDRFAISFVFELPEGTCEKCREICRS